MPNLAKSGVECSCSFICVYMKIISGFPFIDFGKICFNDLLGLTVFDVRCCDCYVIGICCDLHIFWEEWNIKSENVGSMVEWLEHCDCD